MTFVDWIDAATTVVGMFIPILLSVAFVIFLFNIIRYFIFESGSEDGREKARRYIIWSILGFVVIVALWGIVLLLMSILGISGTTGAPRLDPAGGYDFDFWSPTCPITNPDGTPRVGPC